jgi:hypothetical protein
MVGGGDECASGMIRALSDGQRDEVGPWKERISSTHAAHVSDRCLEEGKRQLFGLSTAKASTTLSMLLHDQLIANSLGKGNSPVLDPPYSARTSYTVKVTVLRIQHYQVIHVLAIRAQHLSLVRTLAKMYTLEVRHDACCLCIRPESDCLRCEVVMCPDRPETEVSSDVGLFQKSSVEKGKLPVLYRFLQLL